MVYPVTAKNKIAIDFLRNLLIFGFSEKQK